MSNTQHDPIRFMVASTIDSAEDLLSRLLAFQVIEVRTLDTAIGESTATACRVVDANSGEPVDLGERLIFWKFVQRQLAAATPEVPWVVGRLVKAVRRTGLSRRKPRSSRWSRPLWTR